MTMKYKAANGVKLATVLDEGILMKSGGEDELKTARRLNATGLLFWQAIEDGMDYDEMIAAASESFGISRDEIKPGLDSFLQGLIEAGYLTAE